jgi:hypothetical protein
MTYPESAKPKPRMNSFATFPRAGALIMCKMVPGTTASLTALYFVPKSRHALKILFNHTDPEFGIAGLMDHQY